MGCWPSDLPAADWSTGQCDPYVKMRLFSKGKGKSEANTKVSQFTCFPSTKVQRLCLLALLLRQNEVVVQRGRQVSRCISRCMSMC